MVPIHTCVKRGDTGVHECLEVCHCRFACCAVALPVATVPPAQLPAALDHLPGQWRAGGRVGGGGVRARHGELWLAVIYSKSINFGLLEQWHQHLADGESWGELRAWHRAHAYHRLPLRG